MAEACGVNTRVTAVLNSDIISGVTAFTSTPLAVAIDFCKLPRWSIAAAAMIPLSFERAFRCFNFPGERDIFTSVNRQLPNSLVGQRILARDGRRGKSAV